MRDNSQTTQFTAKKSLGQHFLNSPVVLKQIIESANIQMGEIVLEIGPGTGVLTKALLETGARVIAVEKDHRACELLQERFSSELKSGQLKLIEADVLDRQSFDLLISNLSMDGSYAIVANIPYYITGAILELFLEHEPRPNRMVLLVQKEVAERITAKPIGNEMTGKESVLSISVKAFGIPKIIARVPRGAFTPPPNVDSAILSIENISNGRFKENGIEISRFFEILKAGFAHKRKFLIRNLEAVASAEQLKSAWQELGLNEKARAEDLTLEKWFGLASCS